MIVFPNAKINLGLNILKRRPDGYHDIESCFYPVGWNDGLELIHANKFSFESSGIEIPQSASGNLCIQAYELLKKDYQIPPVKFHLYKNIPIGAGLGGGSSDCSFTLKLLNEFFDLDLKNDELENYAAKLGSDCPFFIKNRAVMASGTGTFLKSIDLDLSEYYIVLVYPGIHISTAEAYAGIKPGLTETSLEEIIKTYPIEKWKDVMKNDFEHSLFPKYPILQDIKNAFYKQGAFYASMTGSGSAIYGLFKDKVDNPFKDYKNYCGFLKN